MSSRITLPSLRRLPPTRVCWCGASLLPYTSGRRLAGRVLHQRRTKPPRHTAPSKRRSGGRPPPPAPPSWPWPRTWRPPSSPPPSASASQPPAPLLATRWSRCSVLIPPASWRLSCSPAAPKRAPRCGPWRGSHVEAGAPRGRGAMWGCAGVCLGGAQEPQGGGARGCGAAWACTGLCLDRPMGSFTPLYAGAMLPIALVLLFFSLPAPMRTPCGLILRPAPPRGCSAALARTRAATCIAFAGLPCGKAWVETCAAAGNC